MRFVLLVFLSGISTATWFGCTKQITEEIHIDTLITGNDPPPYYGVSDVEVTNYINKLYIDLLGRIPTQEEIANHIAFLEDHELNDDARDTLIQELMSKRAFYTRLFDLTSADFINGADSIEIAYEIDLLQLLALLDSINGNTPYLIYYNNEIIRLQALQTLTDDYMNGAVTINEYFAAFLNNYFYDQLNMGSENFVKGAFDDLFRRAPSQAELANGVSMVDNAPAVIFLETGDSKGDFIRIVANCYEFYEGIVLKTYKQLLLRDPESEEMATGIATLEATKDFPAFEREIMKTIEYAGF